MPRSPNFVYRNPLEDAAPALVRAMFGDPAARQQQQAAAAEMEVRRAQAQRERAHGSLYTSQATGQDLQNEAARGLPGLIANLYAEPPPMPSLDDPNFVADAGPSAPIPTRDDIFRQNLPAVLGNMAVMQGDKIDPRAYIGTAASFGGGDEMARRGLVAQGHSPTEAFAITPERADAISARDANEDQTKAFGVARINHANDIPVANIRAGATIGAAQVRADGSYRVAGLKAAGPAPGFDAITAAFPGVKMNSGWRSVEHNRAVGGVDNSTHLGQTPGVQGYDIDAIPGMTVEQAAKQIEAASGGRVQVVEAIDERGRVGPNGKKLGGWHFALKNVGGPPPTSSGKKPGTPKPPKPVSAAAYGQIDKEIDARFTRYSVTPTYGARNALRSRAAELWQQTGNPVLAVDTAFKERADRNRRGSGAAPPPAPAPAPAKSGPSLWAPGVPTFSAGYEADAFVADPRNKGRQFIGPDGKQRVVQ